MPAGDSAVETITATAPSWEKKDVHLGRSSRVTRWVHAVGEFSAEHDCELSGRISSDSCIRLQGACNFLRLNAPQIETGLVMPGKT